jgi:hypothetical protein
VEEVRPRRGGAPSDRRVDTLPWGGGPSAAKFISGVDLSAAAGGSAMRIAMNTGWFGRECPLVGNVGLVGGNAAEITDAGNTWTNNVVFGGAGVSAGEDR